MKTLDHHQMDSYQDQIGRSIAARLSDSTQSLPNDISERLKAARMQALAKRKVVKLQVASSVNGNGRSATLRLGQGDDGLWSRIAGLIPLMALVIGLFTIGIVQEQMRADEVAEVDVELLADELPPAAYADPGFAHFLNTNRRD